MKKLLLVVALVATTGCAMVERKLTVISTPANAEVRRIVVNEGDVLLCDKETCKVVRQ